MFDYRDLKFSVFTRSRFLEFINTTTGLRGPERPLIDNNENNTLSFGHQKFENNIYF